MLCFVKCFWHGSNLCIGYKQLCVQVEGEIEREREMIMVEKNKKIKPKKSFKQLVQQCMTGQGTRQSWS